MTASTSASSSSHRDLLELVALTEFLARSGQQGPAILATERLSEALLVYYQRLPGAGLTEPAALRRDTLRLWAEIRLFSRRLRVGPVRRVPTLRPKVEALLLSEVMAGGPSDSR